MASLVLLGKFHAALIAREFAGLNFCECLHHLAAHGAQHLGRFGPHVLHLVDSRQALIAHDALHLHFRISLYYRKTLNPSPNLTKEVTPSAKLGEAEGVWAVKTALPPSSPIEYGHGISLSLADNLLLRIDLPSLAVQLPGTGFRGEE